MTDKLVSTIDLEQVEAMARLLHLVALAQPAGMQYTVKDLVVKAGLTSQYAIYNRTDCQRLAKAFKRMTHPRGAQVQPPFVQINGYNKQTIMCYNTVTADD